MGGIIKLGLAMKVCPEVRAQNELAKWKLLLDFSITVEVFCVRQGEGNGAVSLRLLSLRSVLSAFLLFISC